MCFFFKREPHVGRQLTNQR